VYPGPMVNDHGVGGIMQVIDTEIFTGRVQRDQGKDCSVRVPIYQVIENAENQYDALMPQDFR
jgi:hypothetical protein